MKSRAALWGELLLCLVFIGIGVFWIAVAADMSMWDGFAPASGFLPLVYGVLLAGLAIAATLVSSGLGLVFPQVIGKLIDASFLKIGSNDTSSLDGTVLMLFAVFGTQFLFGIAQISM